MENNFDYNTENQYNDNQTENQEHGFNVDTNTTSEQKNEKKSTSTNSSELKINVPNSGLILTFGVISIVTICCCFGILSPIFAITAIILAVKAEKEYKQNRDIYNVASMDKVSSGKICAIIGLALGIIAIIFYLTFATSLSDTTKIINFGSEWNQLGY